MKNLSSCCRSTLFYATMFLMFLLAVPQTSNATHLMGGEITVTLVSGNTYRITQKIYRDCAGISLGTTTSVTISPTSPSGSSVTLTRISVTDRSILCPGQVSRCASTAGVPGIEEHVYQGVVTLNPNTTYTISSTLNARNNAITTLVSGGSQSMYVATQFNGNAADNSSPQFLNLPIGTFCINQASTLSPNGFDPDGDALVYSLINARQAAATSVNYAAGFSGTTPLSSSTPITINPNTGLISFTPSVANQVAVICMRVEEYRNGVKIGEIIRDMQIRMIDCSGNTPPTLPSIPSVVVPVGTPFCTNIAATDANNNNITLTAASGIIPPGTFTLGTSGAGFANATFCFTPQAAHAGNTYTVSINALDNACPSPGASVTSFNITVPAPCGVTINANANPASCGASDGNASASLSGGIAPYQYQWSGPGGYSSSASGTITGLAAGTYCVTIVDGNSCVGETCVTVTGGASPVQLGGTATDNTCGLSNGSIDLSASGGTAPYQYSLNGSPSQSSVLFENLAAGTYNASVSDANGCGGTATFTLLDQADVTPPTANCQPLTLQLDAYGNVSTTAEAVNNGSSDNCGGVSLSLSKTSFDCSNLGDNTVTLTVTDNVGNTSTCTAVITVEDNLGPDVECHAATIALDALGSATLQVADVYSHDHEACSVASMTLSQTQFDCSHFGDNTVTLTVIDNSGNESSCQATVSVVDLVAPYIECPDDIETGNDLGLCGAEVTYHVDFGDNCSGAGIYQTAGLPSGSEFPIGTTTNTFVVTDQAGNQVSCSFDVTVTDSEAPVVSCKNATVTLVNGTATITANDVDNGSHDNCGDVETSVSQTNFTCANIGTNTVTLTVTDAAGNTSQCNATVTVVGSLPVISIAVNPSPTVTNGAPNTIYLGYGAQSVTLTASGAGSFTWNASPTLSCTVCAATVASPQATTTYTVTGTNGYGCSASASKTICVIDAREYDNRGRATGKVLVCHYPPGNPANMQTISVGAAAVPAHLAHGCRVGSCNAVCGSAKDEGEIAEQFMADEHAAELEVAAFPNPFASDITLSVHSHDVTPITYRIYNVTGQLVQQNTMSDNVITTGSDLAAGVYFIEFKQNDTVQRIKVTKNN